MAPSKIDKKRKDKDKNASKSDTEESLKTRNKNLCCVPKGTEFSCYLSSLIETDRILKTPWSASTPRYSTGTTSTRSSATAASATSPAICTPSASGKLSGCLYNKPKGHFHNKIPDLSSLNI